ncbi:MAG: hypothetical protein IV095_14940, partial [Sediminibacterium sp.]|nr:hypothetical protein [Sediminibacterium sp.]
MNAHQIVYLVFGIVLSVALIFDLGLLSKKNKSITIKQALNQTIFWVGLAVAFFVFLWIEGPALAADSGGADVSKHQLPFEFLSAYLMEWSL